MKGRRWLKRVIWTPCLLALVGLASLLVVDWKVAADVRREEQLLLNMGIDVRAPTDAMDAFADYDAVIASDPYDTKFDEKTLQALERASKKPFVRTLSKDPSLPFQRSERIPGFEYSTHDWVTSAGIKHDWKMLDRLFQVNVGYNAQLLVDPDKVNIYPSAYSAPLYGLIHIDPQTRSYLRKKLESSEIKRMVQARLASICRDARFPKPQEGQFRPPREPSWWESTSVFKQNIDLTILRHFRKLAEANLKEQPVLALSKDVKTALKKSLEKDPSSVAQFAADRVVWSESEMLGFMSFNFTLIMLDLKESKDQGKPLSPTWSKRYCVDPQTGAPVKVVATEKELKFKRAGSEQIYSTQSGW